MLIFFGVLVLPWLLGPPSEAQKTTSVDDSDAEVIAPLHSTFEDQVLAELEGADPDFVEPEESVYVSKITPVGGAGSEPKKVIDEASASSSADDSVSQQKSKSMAAVLKKAIDKSKVGDVVETQTEKPSAIAGSAEIKTEAVNSTNGDNETSKDPELNANVPTKVDVGWVVQVELLTDKEGANRLVKKLNDNGFRPQTTTVDTNLGKSTGTRIWLGPFAERAGAGRENDRLEKQMGKRGFIRVYP